MMRAIVTALCVMFLYGGCTAVSVAETSINQSVVNVSGTACSHGLHRQPNGPFAIIVFCEDALGTSLAVICYDPGKCDRLLDVTNSKIIDWEVADRVWQQEPWAADITSIAWSSNGKYLYVASTDVYGAGGLFQLDLYRRIHTQILPKNLTVTVSNPGLGYVISGLDTNGKSMRVETRESKDSDTMRTEAVTLPP